MDVDNELSEQKRINELYSKEIRELRRKVMEYKEKESMNDP